MPSDSMRRVELLDPLAAAGLVARLLERRRRRGDPRAARAPSPRCRRSARHSRCSSAALEVSVAISSPPVRSSPGPQPGAGAPVVAGAARLYRRFEQIGTFLFALYQFVQRVARRWRGRGTMRAHAGQPSIIPAGMGRRSRGRADALRRARLATALPHRADAVGAREEPPEAPAARVGGARCGPRRPADLDDVRVRRQARPPVRRGLDVRVAAAGGGTRSRSRASSTRSSAARSCASACCPSRLGCWCWARGLLHADRQHLQRLLPAAGRAERVVRLPAAVPPPALPRGDRRAAAVGAAPGVGGPWRRPARFVRVGRRARGLLGEGEQGSGSVAPGAVAGGGRG